ncbi:hypothetical protein BJ912DRAFT_999605 [Pholiota molesta]|nr:hypothetical protein BJ912DRAFT_999605 [Pholiota molesta]
MQCTWPQLARLAFRGFARPSSTNRTPTHGRLATHSALWLSALFLQHRRLYVSVQTSRDTPSSSAVSSSGPLLDSTADGFSFEKLSKPGYSHAEIGRNAAQAVRVSMQLGNHHDAFLIVQSLYLSRLDHSRLASDSKNEKTRLSALRRMSYRGIIHEDRIEFDKRVSPRLSAHALLHSLIRRGESQRAEDFVSGMASLGTRVRSRSLEAVLEGLADRSSSSPPTHLIPLNRLDPLGVTTLKPHLATNNELTAGALRILQTARRPGGRSTNRMYRYYSRCAREKAKEAAAASCPAGLPESMNNAPLPNVKDLRRICAFITWNFSTPMTDASSKVAFADSLQALANLVHDMDEGRLCVPLEPVITAISKCPRTRESVWISEKGVGLKQVLDRLITSLPDREREQERQRQEAEINTDQTRRPGEPINPFTYNALLHYTLRHCIRSSARSSSASFDELVCTPEDELNPYALSSRITLMVSMGQSKAVIEALPKILPGLYPPASPQGTPTIVAMKAAEKWREDGLSKAVRLGPVVFVALLNALRKDGRTGLAESVFLYGLEAEKRSFETDVSTQEMTVVIRPAIAIKWGLTPEGAPLRYTLKDGKPVDPVKRNVLGRRMIVQMRQGEMDGSMKGKPHLEIDMGRGTHGYAPPEADVWFFESLLSMFMKTPEDPLLRPWKVVRNTWDPAVLEAFAVKGIKVKEYLRDPLGQTRDTRRRVKTVRASVPSRMGWKRWTVAEQKRGMKEVQKEVINTPTTPAPA